MNALEIKNLSKNFPGFRLGDLSLTLPSGCIMGLVGENGAGKSTTIRLILGMLRKDGGTVTVLGRDNGADILSVRQDVGVVLDEVGIPECFNAGQVGNVMRRVFSRWDDNLYGGYLKRFSIPENKEFKDLSRGNKMKLGIAVAMSHDPKLLLLDEATSGLDPVARDDFVELLSDFTRDETHSVLISSHIVSDLEKICDYIAFLHRGTLLLCEEKDRLASEYGVIHCAEEQLRELNSSAVLHKRATGYGVEAVVRREAIPAGLDIGPVSIEELFVQMVREVQ